MNLECIQDPVSQLTQFSFAIHVTLFRNWLCKVVNKSRYVSINSPYFYLIKSKNWGYVNQFYDNGLLWCELSRSMRRISQINCACVRTFGTKLHYYLSFKTLLSGSLPFCTKNDMKFSFCRR